MKMLQSNEQGSSRRDPSASDEEIAVEVVRFLADDPSRLAAFVDETGFDPRRLREVITDGSLRGGLFDHVLGDEPRLIAFAAHIGRDPETAARLLSRHRQITACLG